MSDEEGHTSGGQHPSVVSDNKTSDNVDIIDDSEEKFLYDKLHNKFIALLSKKFKKSDSKSLYVRSPCLTVWLHGYFWPDTGSRESKISNWSNIMRDGKTFKCFIQLKHPNVSSLVESRSKMTQTTVSLEDFMTECEKVIFEDICLSKSKVVKHSLGRNKVVHEDDLDTLVDDRIISQSHA